MYTTLGGRRMRYRKSYVMPDNDIKGKTGADRVVVTYGYKGDKDFVAIQLQWYPLPFVGLCKGGKTATCRLSHEQVDELIDLLKKAKAKVPFYEKEEAEEC